MSLPWTSPMADSELPASTSDALRKFAWNSAPFIFFLLAGERALEEKWLQAAGCLVLFVVNLVIVVKWDQIAASRSRKNLQTFLIWSVGATGAILLVCAVAAATWFRDPVVKESAQQPPALAQSDPLLKDPGINWVGWTGAGRVMFTATFRQSGEKLAVYLDYAGAGGGIGTLSVMNGPSFPLPENRLEIGFIDRYVVGQKLEVTVAIVSTTDGKQQIFQWGDQKYNYEQAKVGVTWGSYVGRIVIFGPDKKMETYPFMVISRSFENAPNPPVILGPKLLSVFDGWSK